MKNLHIRAYGRPAPQGSKKYGSAGQMREASHYLPAWRAAVRRAALDTLLSMNAEREDLPWFFEPVSVSITFLMHPGLKLTAPPDLDKLVRSVLDALTSAKVWGDDAQVIELCHTAKTYAESRHTTGALIDVRALTPWDESPA